jgi:L-2-hydroxycarboxylate dehydrogenase (NAD+)
MTSLSDLGSDDPMHAERLRDAVVQILVAEGATPDDAAEQADLLIEGDLRGHPSHGVRRLPVLVGRMRSGLITSGLAPTMTWQTESFLAVDGRRGFGPVVARVAIEQIVERACTSGIAVAAVHNANHIGMLAPYVERIADAGQVGIALTTSEALVHPWGGARPMIGTNPIGIAVPTQDQPLVVDMSTAAVSMGKILDHAEKDTPIPLGWGVDGTGAPSTDPRAVIEGAVSPFGGPKGFALGIALEVLIGAVTGTSFGTDKRGTLDTEHVATKGDLFLAISLERLGRSEQLAPLTEYLEQVRASGPGGLPLTVPGDRARSARQARLANGITLSPDLWNQLQRLLPETTP